MRASRASTRAFTAGSISRPNSTVSAASPQGRIRGRLEADMREPGAPKGSSTQPAAIGLAKPRAAVRLRSGGCGCALRRRKQADDGRFVVRLGNKMGVAEPRRQIVAVGRGDESEGDLPIVEGGGKLEAFAIQHVNVEEREFEGVGEALAGLRQRAVDTDHLMPLALDDSLKVQRDKRVVFQNKHPHAAPLPFVWPAPTT